MTIHIHKEIEKLKSMILKMGAMVEQNFRDAIKAVSNMDIEMAQSIIKSEDKVDDFEIEIEEECLKTLALHQPVAIDLRLVVAILKINNELERINDFNVNIAERILDLSKRPKTQIPFDVDLMADKVLVMLSESLDSLINMDTEQAYNVIRLDDEVDSMHQEVYEIVKLELEKTPELVEVIIQYPSLSRYLERIADLAVNISEDVIYMVEGHIIRHQEES